MRRARRKAAYLALVAAVPAVTVPLALAQGPALDAHLGIPEGGGPIDVGPIPEGLDAIDAASCGACHRRHLREWRRSAHHAAFTNALFREEAGPTPRPFCARCHAPRGIEEAGVDCAACHVRDGAVVNPRVSGRAPHASREVASLAGTIACARCHDFAFERQPELRMQSTVEEWMSSAHRDRSCQSCHMPSRPGHHDHSFPGGLDARMVRDAVAVEARAERDGEDTRLTLDLSAAAAGHAVPTGDLFRRIEVRAWPVGAPELEERVWLYRRFRVDRRGWHPLEDERVPASGSRRVSLLLLGAHERVAVRVHLWRTTEERAQRMGWPVEDVRRTLYSGTVRARR